uniref:Alpha box domain-containing protein n=1 Tax=Bionectria ochroleuca TaxID=29856 RepID=A0A8H7N0P0_BIOOC
MAKRAELAQRLASIPSEDLLTHLGDEALANLATHFQGATMPADRSSPGGASTDEDSNQRAKRPLNAFIAFRSYYLKMFPDLQQKAASGLLTNLWNQDPFRNKWALIAKVYSFIRDEIGKDRISLPFFLGVCCPIMNIIEPAVYLSTLGRSVEVQADGTQKVVRVQVASPNNFAQSQAQGSPTTEIDLLQAILKAGYLPRESAGLLQRMSLNTNGMMTTSPIQASPTIPPTMEKLDFINTIRNDPIQATKEIFSAHYDDRIMREHGYRVYTAQDLNAITHLPMALPIPQPIPYRYAHTHYHLGLGNQPIMDFNNIPQNGCYDISNPFHMDHLLGHTDCDGDRAAGHPDSPPFDPHEDFQYMF